MTTVCEDCDLHCAEDEDILERDYGWVYVYEFGWFCAACYAENFPDE